MPLPPHTSATQASCPHAAKATFAASASKVTIDGAPVLLEGDAVSIAGCPFTVPTGKPQPCVEAVLQVKTAKLVVEGKAVLLQGPGDLCESAEKAPQGPLAVSRVQSVVTAS